MQGKSGSTQGKKTKDELKLSGIHSYLIAFQALPIEATLALSSLVTEKVRVVMVQTLIEPRKQPPVSCVYAPLCKRQEDDEDLLSQSACRDQA